MSTELPASTPHFDASGVEVSRTIFVTDTQSNTSLAITIYKD